MIAYVIAEHTLTILSTFEQGYRGAEVEKIFFFLSSRYNCAIFSAAFKKFEVRVMRIYFKKSYFLCFIWNLLLQKCENCPDFLHFCWIIEEEPYAFSMFWKYFLPNLDFGYIFCHLGWQDLPLFASLLKWEVSNINFLLPGLEDKYKTISMILKKPFK